MKKLKILFWLIGVIVSILLGALLVITTLVDPNEYKPNIEQLVESKTGRQLKLDGDLELTFYPWIGLKTGAVELSNRAGFGDTPMLSVDQINLKVKLIPLLKKELQIGDVILTQPKVQLITLKDGSMNWDDLINKTVLVSDEQETKGVLALAGFAVQGVSIIDGEALWDDRAAEQHIKITDLDFTTGKIQPGVPLNLNLSAQIEGSLLSRPIALDFSATTVVNNNLVEVELNNLSTHIQMDDKAFSLSVPSLSFNAETQNLKIPDFKLDVEDLSLAGSLTGSGVMDTPALSSQLSFTAPNVISLLQEYGIELDPGDHKIENVEVETGFSYFNDTIELNSFLGKLDLNEKETAIELPFASLHLPDQKVGIPAMTIKQSELSVNARLDGVSVLSDINSLILNGLMTIKLRNLQDTLVNNNFNGIIPIEAVDIGAIDLETKFKLLNGDIELQTLLLNTVINGKDTVIKSNALQLGLSSQQHGLSGFSINQDELQISTNFSGSGDLTALDKLELSGKLKFNVSTLPEVMDNNGLEGILPKGLVNDISSEMDYKLENGDLLLSSMTSEIDNTTLSGNVRFNSLLSEEDLNINIKQKIENIDVGHVLTTFDISEDLDGVGDANLELTGLRPDTDNPIGNLSGLMEFELKNGAIKGFDLQAALIKLDSAVKSVKGNEETQYQPDAQTRFSDLSAGFNGKGGRFYTNDIVMKAPALRVHGEGNIDFSVGTLDLGFDVSVVKTIEGQGGETLENLEGATIPLRVNGNLSAPSYGMDLTKLIKNEAKKEIKKKLEEALLGDQLPDQAGGTLEEKLEKKLEEKVTEKLFDLFGS